MINLVRRWFANRNRQIFSYWDGRRVRKADPLVVYRKLDNDPEFDWETHPEMIDSGEDGLADNAMEITANAVKRAFNVEPFDGAKGLTENECIGLLVQFVDYLTALKKNGNTSQTTPASTGLTDSILEPKDSLAYSSTLTEQKPAEQSQS